MRLNLDGEAVELLRRKFVAGVDDRSGRPCGVVEQAFRPARRGVVNVHSRRSSLHRRQPVMVVLRMERPDMQHGRDLPDVKAMLPPGHRIVIGGGPAIGPGNNRHSIGTKDMQFSWQSFESDRLNIGVARK